VHPIRIGTCGWSYEDWRGPFYPDGLPSRDFLSWYADRYPVVEVDSTFYRSPSLKTVQSWRDRTPDKFGFSLKVPQVITHEKVLLDCQEEVEGFVAAAQLLGEKLLCCVLQFGYFNRSVFQSLDQFLARLRLFLAAWPRDVPVAVEVRNKAWMTGALGDCLREANAIWVLPDQAWMPPPLGVAQKLDTVTGPYGYVRLLGDRDAVDRETKKLDRIVVERDAQVRADAELIQLLSRRVPVLAFVNNHFAGYAPATIEQLRMALGAGPAAAETA